MSDDLLGFADLATIKGKYAARSDSFILGNAHPDHGKSFPVGISDDRHLFVMAGSRAGKGTSMIIPNLLHWQGGIFCIDPKGENANITAMRRGTEETAKGTGTSVRKFLGQKVAVLDPMGIGQRTISHRDIPPTKLAQSMSHIDGTIKIAVKGPYSYSLAMITTLIGYARCSTDSQDLTAQKQALENLGVAPDRIYTDHGLTGTNRALPGLDQAIAAVREGDTLVVPKLDRLARSVPDARTIADQLQEKGVKLALGASIYDPSDPMGKMFFNILATFAEFEADLIRMRTREGMAIARAKGKLRGKQPKLSEKQQRELCRMHATGDYSISDLAEVFSVSRPTVYRTLQRHQT